MLTSTAATLHDNSTHGDDSYLVRPLGDTAFVDAVMDGMTGRQGQDASRAVRDALAAARLASPEDLVAVLEAVNQNLYQRGWGRFWLTTVAAALFLDDTLYVIGVGDSPVLLIRADSCQLLCHRVAGGMHAAIARAVGASGQLLHLSRTAVPVKPGDRLLLATDGVTDTVTNSELTELIRQAASPNDAAERINTILTARQQQAHLSGDFRRDDWTAIIRFFSPASSSLVAS
jgi:serine/threonine protein phosphatase PrpC